MLRSPSLYCSPCNRPANQETSCWDKEEWIYSESQETKKSSVPKNQLTRVRIQASCILKGEGGGGGCGGEEVAGCCKLLGAGILCSCSCPCRSGHDVPINLPRDKCYSLFCNFSCLYEWKSATPLKVRALRMGYPVYFRLPATFFHKGAEPAWLSTGNRAQGLALKD